MESTEVLSPGARVVELEAQREYWNLQKRRGAMRCLAMRKTMQIERELQALGDVRQRGAVTMIDFKRIGVKEVEMAELDKPEEVEGVSNPTTLAGSTFVLVPGGVGMTVRALHARDFPDALDVMPGGMPDSLDLQAIDAFLHALSPEDRRRIGQTVCPACQGRGMLAPGDEDPDDCWVCHGSGLRPEFMPSTSPYCAEAGF